MSDKLVTIITSVYRPKFFKEFVQDTIRQTIFEDCQWEIFEVGVENKSYKESLPDNVNYQTAQSRLSIYQVWNSIIKESKTPFLCNYNVDDRSSNIHLEKLVDTLELNESLDMAYCPNFETQQENETFEKNSSNNKGFPCNTFDVDSYWKNNSAHARPCWRASLHDRFGYFDESYKICADYEFWLRCIKGGAVFSKACALPLYLYYRSPVGASSSQDGVKDALEEIKAIRIKYGYLGE